MRQLHPARVKNEETIQEFTSLPRELLRSIDQVHRYMLMVHLAPLLWVFQTSLRLHWVNNSIDGVLGHHIWDLLLLATVLPRTLLEHRFVLAQVLHHILHRADVSVVLFYRLGV
jgi:hypothetical protein